jgi:hypothetical protein
MAIRKRLGEMLVEAGIIDDSQLHAALAHQRQWGGRLGAALIEMKLVSEQAIVDALALKFGFEIARLDRIEHYAFEQARAFVSRDYAVRNRVFPLAADTGVLTVAMSDPTNLAIVDELAFKSGRRVKVCITGEHALAAAIRSFFGEDPSGAREAIPLDAEDDVDVEPLYDPIGATSNEQMNQLYEQPSAAEHAPAPGAHAAVARAPAAGGRAQAVTTPPDRPRSRTPSVLQLEDQKTGSLPLDALQPLEPPEEELQPEPIEGEPLAEGEAAGAAGEPHAPQEAGGPSPHELTPEEAAVLDALWRMADGDDATPTVVKPGQLLAALLRLMMRKQWITEQELLDELLRGGEPR